jgi:hypothetical protein
VSGAKRLEKNDVICLVVPDEVDPAAPSTMDRLEELGQASVLAQWPNGRAPKIEFDPIEWMLTSDPAKVNDFQPAHDCEQCRSGNAKAIEFLTANPGKTLAMGNIHYTEVWPGWAKL